MVSTRVTPNAQQVPVNIVGGNRYGRYSKISSEYTQNMFVTSNGYEPGAELYESWLVNYPYYKRVLDFSTNTDINPPHYPNKLPIGEGRGLFHSSRGNFLIAVINSIVYRIGPNLNPLQIGALSSNTGDVYMDENLSQQICIVDGTNAWIYNYSGAGAEFTIQTLTNGLVPNYVEYQNTFFLFGNGDTTSAGSQWFTYVYDTPSTIIQFPTNSSLALQTKPDYALAVKRMPGSGNNALVLGKTVCEIWTQVTGLQPYIRQPTININYGCLSVATIAEGGNFLAWLGANENERPVIIVFDGQNAQEISTDGIDYLLSTVDFPDQSSAMMYKVLGHLVYQLTFYAPEDNFTIIYDFETKMFFNLTDQYGNYHPARQIVFFNLTSYFVSLKNAAMYEMSTDITVVDENLPKVNSESEYNDALVYLMPKIRITSNIRQADSSRYRANSLVITLEQGADPLFTEADLQRVIGNAIITEQFNNPSLDDVLTESGQIVIMEDAYNAANNIISPIINSLIPAYVTGIIYKPTIILQISKTGGVSWGNGVARTLHPLGKRQNILHYENMGVANDLCLRFEFNVASRIIVGNGLLDIVL